MVVVAQWFCDPVAQNCNLSRRFAHHTCFSSFLVFRSFVASDKLKISPRASRGVLFFVVSICVFVCLGLRVDAMYVRKYRYIKFYVLVCVLYMYVTYGICECVCVQVSVCRCMCMHHIHIINAFKILFQSDGIVRKAAFGREKYGKSHVCPETTPRFLGLRTCGFF